MKKRIIFLLMAVMMTVSCLASCGGESAAVKIPEASYTYTDADTKTTFYYPTANFEETGYPGEDDYSGYIVPANNGRGQLELSAIDNAELGWESAESTKEWYEDYFDVVSSAWKNNDENSDTFIVSYLTDDTGETARVCLIKVTADIVYRADVLCVADDVSMWSDIAQNQMFIVTDGESVEFVK